MRINIRRASGSALIVILVITGLMGVTLASYLHMVSNQNQSIMRSMAWNEAVAVSEAGIEEAMAHLNQNRTNRTRDGWTLEGTNVVKTKMIGNQKYKTYVDAYADRPDIVSEGWVRDPKSGEFLPLPRSVRVKTTNDAIFAKGMVAKGQIDLSGNGILSDSFDSSDPAKSTGGQYDPAKRGDKGDVATNSSVVDSLNVWNAEVYGKASTGPGGNLGIHKGTVGSLAYHASGKTGVEPGWSTDDMNVYFPDVSEPSPGIQINNLNMGLYFPTWPTIENGVNVTYDYRSSGGTYTLKTGLTLNNKKLYIAADTTLIVEGGLSISGQGEIVIAPGVRLDLYMKGSTASIGGNGIANRGGNASNFSYWGMPSNTEVTIQGNGDFIGTVYAPQAMAKFGGGGSSGDDFIGALVSNQIKLNGHYKFHYDESLGKFGPRRGYTIITWNETGWNEI
jgi:hypothetical protein